MRTVWKFPIPIPDERCRAYVELPIYAQILSVGMQNDQMFVWALIHPSSSSQIVRHRLLIANTGYEIPDWPMDPPEFLGTLHASSGCVWHVWRA